MAGMEGRPMSESSDTQLSAYGRHGKHLQRDHLKARKKGAPEDLQPTLERNEAWCTECSNRVTCGSKEWGHEPDCSHLRDGGA